MNVFLSYASQDRPSAEEIALALRNDGHEVFFDRTQLEGGENYHQVIRDSLADADLFVFLISPNSVQAGSYALSELRGARRRWPSPVGHVVPVLLQATSMDDVPAYLKAVTLFESRGNTAAELTAHLHHLSLRAPRRRRLTFTAALCALVVVLVIAAYFVRAHLIESPFRSTIAESDFISYFLLEDLDRKEYTLDPTSGFPTNGDDFIIVHRLAFGEIADHSSSVRDRRNGFSIRVSVNNYTDDPIQLDLSPRFFELVDDKGQFAELLFFCCEANGSMLAPGQRRVIQLIYGSASGWSGKETTPGEIHFRITGLLPVLRASWSFRPLATAN